VWAGPMRLGQNRRRCVVSVNSWTSKVASIFGSFGGSQKIKVLPLSLAPNRTPVEFWSSYYALGCVVAYAKVHRDRELLQHFDFGRITPAQADDMPALIKSLPTQPAVYLLSSYVWNHPVNCDVARAIKQRSPGSLVIAGGPHIPRDAEACEEYFAEHPYIDVTVRHEGEVTLAELLRRVSEAPTDRRRLAATDFEGVEGVTFRRAGALVRTPDRARTLDPSIYPSPYTTGEFDHWVEGRYYLPLETNRGCPYGCTFCDWGAATLAKIARFSMERVLGEIEFAARHRIHLLGLCDANFGILPRDVEIAQFIVQMKQKYGFPRELGYTNAKTASPRLTEIIKILADGGLISSGQISMQTTDEQILDNVKRSNIKMSEYRKMISFFHKEGIPAVSDLMLGLPGQTFETCKKDLQFCFDHKVTPMLFATSVMPNAPMADRAYREKFKIVVGKDGFVESTYSFSREEYGRMFDLGLAYKLFVKLGLLKYLLYYVQLEHGIKALDVLERWLLLTSGEPQKYPISTRIRRELIDRDRGQGLKDWILVFWSDEQAQFLFDSLEAFHEEIFLLFQQEFGVVLDSTAARAVMKVNREIMPKKRRPMPARIELDHDVAGYFTALSQAPSIDTIPDEYVPLGEHGPGFLDLTAQGTVESYGFHDMVSLVGKLEMASNVRI
jgi:radical SAM superfamily enzyme YgiQ (UPF0313 family)